MTILVVIQHNLGHCILFRTFLVVVYDIFGDFWSSFMCGHAQNLPQSTDVQRLSCIIKKHSSRAGTSIKPPL